jgi:uncharacterized protein
MVPESLAKFFAENSRLALAFSGGTDSSYLLYAAKKSGCDVRAYYIHSQFQPEFEFQDAKRLADELGAEMTVIEMDVLAAPIVSENPADRCYHCKRALFEALTARAKEDGFGLLIDGTNASDDAGDRPGMRALRELKIVSPLRDLGITKPMVREYARLAGLFIWDKPAYACLATRVPTGQKITGEILQKVERAENALFKMGFHDFRARVIGSAARLQFKGGEIAQAFERRAEIIKALEGDFDAVLLDLKER